MWTIGNSLVSARPGHRAVSIRIDCVLVSYTHDLSDSHCLPGPDCLFQPVLLLLLLTGAYTLISFIVVPQATQLQVHVAGGRSRGPLEEGQGAPNSPCSVLYK